MERARPHIGMVHRGAYECRADGLAGIPDTSLPVTIGDASHGALPAPYL